jgi:hypothetical protein
VTGQSPKTYKGITSICFFLDGKEDFEQVILEVVPIVKKHFSQSGTEQGGNNHIDKKRFQIFLIYFFFDEHLFVKSQAQKECDDEHEAVDVYAKTTDFE